MTEQRRSDKALAGDRSGTVTVTSREEARAEQGVVNEDAGSGCILGGQGMLEPYVAEVRTPAKLPQLCV